MKPNYECPACHDDVPVAGDANKVRCPHCRVNLLVDHDAEFVNGLWRDLTHLVLDPDEYCKCGGKWRTDGAHSNQFCSKCFKTKAQVQQQQKGKTK